MRSGREGRGRDASVVECSVWVGLVWASWVRPQAPATLRAVTWACVGGNYSLSSLRSDSLAPGSSSCEQEIYLAFVPPRATAPSGQAQANENEEVPAWALY